MPWPAGSFSPPRTFVLHRLGEPGVVPAPTRRSCNVSVMNLMRETAIDPPCERAAVEGAGLARDLLPVPK